MRQKVVTQNIDAFLCKEFCIKAISLNLTCRGNNVAKTQSECKFISLTYATFFVDKDM